MSVAQGFNIRDPDIYRVLLLAVDRDYLMADGELANHPDYDAMLRAMKGGLIRHAEGNLCLTGFALTRKGRIAVGLPVEDPTAIEKVWGRIKATFT